MPRALRGSFFCREGSGPMNALKIASSCVAFVLSAIAATGQTAGTSGLNQAKLSGKVIDGVLNTPLVGALVTVEGQDAKNALSDVTEKDGSYEITGLAP